MKKHFIENKDDELVGYFYCESIMALNPWNLWYYQNSEKLGEPMENTLELKSILEGFLKKNQNHLGFRHQYIHVMELSPEPELADESNFEKPIICLAPSLGHLCHMPSHI